MFGFKRKARLKKIEMYQWKCVECKSYNLEPLHTNTKKPITCQWCGSIHITQYINNTNDK